MSLRGMFAQWIDWHRLLAVMVKEFIQMRRDKTTFAMMVGVPLMQLILFGYAINTNPRSLPVAVVDPEPSVYSRRLIAAMQESTYFAPLKKTVTEAEGAQLLKTGRVQFVLTLPPHFAHDVVKGLTPPVLLEADASDPVASSSAISVFRTLADSVYRLDLKGVVAQDKSKPPFEPIIHAVYNPLAITAYNIVPGLLGVVLTMTMVVITALAITREAERGTMENLLATPLRPLEVMVGKIGPYIIVGYIQVLLIIVLAKLLFGVPMQGSIVLLLVMCLPFIAANLAMGLTFSTLASNQLQAVQSAMFFFLPSMLLSGFMFPYRGMPEWAQWVGSMLPLTHFLVIVRGILLKGNGFFDVWREVLPILGFTVVVLSIGFKRYRKTLD